MINNPKTKLYPQNNQQRLDLTEAFKEKGIFSVHDKRRIMKDVLGFTAKMRSLSGEEIDRLTDYVESKSAEELVPPTIAWVAITQNREGVAKAIIQKILLEVPGGVDVDFFTQTFHKEPHSPITVHGFMDTFFLTTHPDAFHSISKSVAKKKLNSDETVLYVIDDQFNLQGVEELSSSYQHSEDRIAGRLVDSAR